VTWFRIGMPHRLALALTAAVLAFGLVPGSARGQDENGPARGLVSDVEDGARMFDADAVRKARNDLLRVEQETRIATRIETVAQVDDEPIREVLTRKARRWGKGGVFVLIDKKDRKIEIALTGGAQDTIDRSRQTAIRDAIVAGFKQGDFNKGLERGVAAIESAALSSRVKAAPRTEDYTRAVTEAVAGAGGERHPESTLLQKNQVRLTLAGARLAVAGAEAHAAKMGWKMNVAVVDDGGHLLAFARMDGARPASGYTAITKATTAATFRQETGPLPRGSASPDVLLNLSLQNAAAASGGKITTLHGGIPIVVDGQVIGAVGVGGGTGDQDAEVARSGVVRLTQGLKPAAEAGEKPRRDTDETPSFPPPRSR